MSKVESSKASNDRATRNYVISADGSSVVSVSSISTFASIARDNILLSCRRQEALKLLFKFSSLLRHILSSIGEMVCT